MVNTLALSAVVVLMHLKSVFADFHILEPESFELETVKSELNMSHII